MEWLNQFLAGVHGKWYRYCCPSRYQEYAVVRTASRYDMTSAPSEQYYAGIYLDFIRSDLREQFGSRTLSILDAGCGQGRFSLPLAREGHSVTGWDLSPEVVETARAYAQERGLDISYAVRDLNTLDQTHIEPLYDCIICLEVLYMTKDPWGIIRALRNLLKKDGLLIVSLRPRYYYQVQAVSNVRMDDPVFNLEYDGGYVNGLYFNWISRQRWITACESLGLIPKHYCGIGVFSGIPGDPLAAACVPSDLSESAREKLKKLELTYAEPLAEHGRYIYLSASRREDPDSRPGV